MLRDRQFRGATGSNILSFSGAAVNPYLSVSWSILLNRLHIYRCYADFSRVSVSRIRLMLTPSPLQISNRTEENFSTLNRQIIGCERCPRLIEHCRHIAVTRRRAFRDCDYWGKPVPSFGDVDARLLILGLAPGAHGANRTGRMFTGDRSGEFLYRSLYAAGFASQPTSQSIDDGLELRDAWITACGHCAPPDNKPTPEELRNCRPFLLRELELLTKVRVVVVLGKIAFDTYLGVLKSRGEIERLSDFAFGHNVFHPLAPNLLCSYHPSQQNTSTGKLTQKMLDEIFARAAGIIRSGPDPAVPRLSSQPSPASRKR